MNSTTIKKKIQLSGNIRDAAWMTRQFQKGRLRIESYNTSGSNIPISETIFNQFKTCIRIINEIYEDNWDIDFYISFRNRKAEIYIRGILILFPEITINNRDNRTHLIKDLLVKIIITNTNNVNIRIERLQGARLTLSYAEYQSDYFHSHLPTTNSCIYQEMVFPHFDNFCTGSGEINIFQADLNGDGFTEEKFMRYAMQIMSLVNYESIEGTPYRHIRSISARSRSGSLFYIDNFKHNRFKSKVLNFYKSNNRVPILNITLDSSNSYCIANDEVLDTFINNVDFTESDKRDFFSTVGETGIHYAFGYSPEFSNPPIITNTFIFRSEVKNLTIQSAPTSNGVVEYKVNPNLVKYLIKEIEYELNQNKIRQSTIDRYKVKPSDATKSIQSDPIPVPADS